jgi:hypothetical protein
VIRILRTELRRSSALWIAPALAVLGGPLLYPLVDDWGSRWTVAALWQRDYLYIFWPLALGAGAWQGRRESRSRVLELIGTTARPSWQRSIPTAGALAIAVVVGYLGMFAAAGAQVATTASYFPIASIPVVAVGALSLVAAVWLGLGIGRLLPSAFTPPAIVVTGLLVLLAPPMINYWLTKGEASPAAILLTPTLNPVFRREFVAVAASVHAGQALWFTALAATGFALFASARVRDRLVALVPAFAGVAVALAVLPASTEAAVTVPDRESIAPVCTSDAPKVCVTTVHAGALKDLRGPARQALQILATKLPQAPTSVAESPTSWIDENGRPQPADTLLVELWINEDGAPRTTHPDLLWEFLDGAGTRRCANTVNDDADGRLAVAAWLRDDTPRGKWWEGSESKKMLEALRELPAAEQTSRVAAFRKAALACENRDLDAILTGTDGQ